MTAPQDHYAVLGLSEDASAADIRRQYRKLARENHPDKNPGDAEAAERYGAVLVAWDTLGDETKRKAYLRGERRSTGGDFDSAAPTWTPAQANDAAQAISRSRRVGETAYVRGTRYVVELVTFGEGDAAVTRAALTAGGEVLETDVAAPTSHTAADAATLQRFARGHTEILPDMRASATRRADFAAVVGELRDALCHDDPGLGEGNAVDVNDNIYEVRIVPFDDNGTRRGVRVLTYNGACLEELPDTADPMPMATADDLRAFFQDRQDLGAAIDEFIGRRNAVRTEAPKLRRGLDAGDAVEVRGTTYSFDAVTWRVATGEETGLVLCADGRPLERIPGRPTNPDQRGLDLDALRRFEEDIPVVDGGFRQLLDLRSKLGQVASTLMRDLRAGDAQPWGDDFTLHVVGLGWANPNVRYGGGTGTMQTLCLNEIALNPHFGQITSPGYRRATAQEALDLTKPNLLRNVLRPLIEPRERERAAAIAAADAQRKADDRAARAERGGLGHRIARFARGTDNGYGTGSPMGSPPPPPPSGGGNWVPPQADPSNSASKRTTAPASNSATPAQPRGVMAPPPAAQPGVRRFGPNQGGKGVAE